MTVAGSITVFYRPFTRHPKWTVGLVLSIVLVLWSLTWYSVGSQVGKPFPGFFTNPERIVSSFTPQEFTGWQAGLHPWDMIVAVNGQSWREMDRLVQAAGIGKTLTYTVERDGHTLDIDVPTMVFTPEILFSFLPGYFISSLFFLLIGIFIFLRRPSEVLNGYLLLYLLVWALGGSIVWECFLSQNKWLAYLLFPYAITAPVAGWIFFWSFPADGPRYKFLHRWPLIQAFAVLAVATVVLTTGLRALADGFNSADLWRILAFLEGWPYFIVFGLGSIPIKVTPLLIILFRKGDRLLHQQASVMLAGLLLGLSGWYLFLWAPASIHIPPIGRTQWGGLISALYPLAIGYAILRYHLLDIRVVIRKGLVYSLLTASLTAVFVLLSLFSSYLFQLLSGEPTLWGMILPALLVAFLFQPVRSRIQVFVDRAFFRKEYEARQALIRFSQELSKLRTRYEVIQLVRSTIIDTLGAQDASLWLPDGEQYIPYLANHESGNAFAKDGPLVSYLANERCSYYPLYDDLSAPAAELWRAGGVLAVPLCTVEKLTGVLTLAERASGFSYSQEDLELLSMLANSAALALENAQLYEERMETMREQFFHSVTIQEEERRRIARELHDGVGPSLASLNIRLQTVRKQLEREENPIAQEVTELAEQAQGNIHDIRRLIYDLRPAALDELGLIPAVREYIMRYQKDQGIAVALDIPNSFTRLSPQLETSLFRMVQEGLANVAMHACARQVQIQFKQTSSETCLHIRDDGQGFDPQVPLSGNHLGLWSMQKRVEQFGGCIIIQSKPGCGTEVTIQIPVEKVPEEGKSSNG